MSEGPSTESAGLSARIGFWLGWTLLAAGLLLPPPQSMQRTVRANFAADIAAEVRALLGVPRFAAIDPDELERRVVAARAETMMAAAAATAVVATWWMTVALPIPVTSLVPMVLLPLLGVTSMADAARPYANANIFLFMGGFILALAVQRWGLHRRLALQVIRRLGAGQSTLVLGFMVASALLSMWISNTATTMMMLPIGLAVVSAVAELQAPSRQGRHFATALMLGTAYGASIGGMATPIGTPPNIAFRGQVTQLFPDAPELAFAHWVLACGPLVLLFLPLAWLVLTRVTCPLGRGGPPGAGDDVVRRELRALGPMQVPERRVAVIFASTALLWMTRSLPLGDADVGWAALVERALGPARLPHHGFRSDFVHDATVALAMAVVLFIVPAGRRHDSPSGSRERLMDWPTACRLPWGILLLFGGGFAIAEAFRSTGLSLWCGELFADLHLSSPLALVLSACGGMTFLTEITSNTATSQVMLPILARAAVALHVHPYVLMLPATLSASCAFMLPVATPPNAIVFGSGHVRMRDMVRSGLILNILGAALITTVFFLVTGPLLGIDTATVPDWAGLPPPSRGT